MIYHPFISSAAPITKEAGESCGTFLSDRKDPQGQGTMSFLLTPDFPEPSTVPDTDEAPNKSLLIKRSKHRLIAEGNV